MNAELKAILDKLHAEFGPDGEPGSTPLTSNQMKARADNRRHIATQLKISGQGVNKDYE